MNPTGHLLAARTRALRQRHPAFAGLFRSLPTIDKLATRSLVGPAAKTAQRLTHHYDVVLDCLEQTAAIEAAGLAHSWPAGLTMVEFVDLPLSNASNVKVVAAGDTLLLKAVALITLNRERDYLDIDILAARAGHRVAAAIFVSIDEWFPTNDGDDPMSTQLVRRLGAPQWSETAAMCASLVAHMLLHNESPAATAVHAPELFACCGTPDDWSTKLIVEAIDTGGIAQWRRIAAFLAENPWCPTTKMIEKATTLATDTAVAAAICAVVELVRAQRERLERQEVARQVAAHVADSQLTQSEFAVRVGTSASRLSTYVNGSVTPSAAMMLRMGAVAALMNSATADGSAQSAKREPLEQRSHP